MLFPKHLTVTTELLDFFKSLNLLLFKKCINIHSEIPELTKNYTRILHNFLYISLAEKILLDNILIPYLKV